VTTVHDMDLKRLDGRPHLRGIHLRGFKGVGDLGVDVPLRPLTVVYGPNSGGKSTILKALSSIAQTRHKNSLFAINHFWSPSGIWFDLGAKGQVAHRGEGPRRNTFTLGFQFSDISSRFPWIDSNGERIARPNSPLAPQSHNRVMFEDMEEGRINAAPDLKSRFYYDTSFELPEKLPKNHILFFSPTGSSSPRNRMPIWVADDSNIDLEYVEGIVNYQGAKQYVGYSKVHISKVQSIERDGRHFFDVEYSIPTEDHGVDSDVVDPATALEPAMWASKVLQLNSRIDLTYRFPVAKTGNKYELVKIEFLEERKGEFHNILTLNSGKLRATDWSIKPDNEKSVYYFTHHNCPSITDPGTVDENEKWADEDLKSVVTLAKLMLPIKYKIDTFAQDDYTDIVSCRPRSGEEESIGWTPSEFSSMIRSVDQEVDKLPDEDEQQRQDLVIDGIDTLLEKYGFRSMSILEKRALRKFLNPHTKIDSKKDYSAENSLSRKKPLWQLVQLYNQVQPRIPQKQVTEGLIEGMSRRDIEEETEIGSRTDYVKHFDVYRNSLMPYTEIDQNLTVGKPRRRGSQILDRWGSLPTNSRWHFSRLYWSTIQYIEEIVEHMKRIDYLSASRLSPERIYSSEEVDRAGIRGERSIANLHSKFPKGSPRLDALNRYMEEVLEMNVQFNELLGPYKQGTGLVDVRVGRPGKRKISQLPDVGFGVSQTLPVLAALVEANLPLELDSPISPMLVIEEAESNLHPAAQARLMKLIMQELPIETGPSIVLETHSEHFLKTILHQLSEGDDLTDDDVAIVYVDEDERGMYAVHMETRNGEFLHPWPRPARWSDPTSPII